MIRIEVPTKEIITRRKRDNSGDYYQQVAYAFTVNRDGVEDSYPVKILVMLSKNKTTGNPTPYEPGFYTLSPSSLRVNNYSRLEIGFVNLVPLNTKTNRSQPEKDAA